MKRIKRVRDDCMIRLLKLGLLTALAFIVYALYSLTI